MDYTGNNQGYDWNSAIEDDREGGDLLETGDYNAVISWVERGRYNGGKKLPACNMAKVTLRVAAPDGPQEIDARLYLHKRMDWNGSFRNFSALLAGKSTVSAW